MQDISSQIKVTGSIAPAAQTITVTASAGVSLAPGEAAAAIVHVGAVTTLDGTNKFTLTILTGDDSGGSGAAAIDTDAYITPRDEAGAEWDRVLDADATANTTFKVGFLNKSNHAYAFAKLTAASSPSAIIGVVIAVGGLKQRP